MCASHKKQHYVPKVYLGAWVDQDRPQQFEPYVWVFKKECGEGRKRAPQNTFTETDMYTIRSPNGGRDLSFEHGLSQIESGISRLRSDYLERRKILPYAPKLKLLTFVAAMSARTPTFRNHHRAQFQNILDAAKSITEQFEAMPNSTRLNLPPPLRATNEERITLSELEQLAEYPIQNIAPLAIAAQVPILWQMRITVLCAPSGSCFITTDNPLVWYDPMSHLRPAIYRNPGLMTESVQVSMPISPSQCVVFTHGEFGGQIAYVDATEREVSVMNRRALRYADREIVTNKAVPDPDPFKPT